MSKNILILSPHTDDAEIGCGGLMSRYKNDNIKVVAFSYPHDVEITASEFKKSMESFSFSYELLDYPIRNFYSVRQEILEKMVLLNKETKWDWIICPSTYDTHQDHEVIRNEAFRAFKKTTIMGYEMPWNNLTIKLDMFIILNEENVKDKKTMIDIYESQSCRSYVKDYIFDIARTRGLQVGHPYAEAYEVIRIII